MNHTIIGGPARTIWEKTQREEIKHALLEKNPAEVKLMHAQPGKESGNERLDSDLLVNHHMNHMVTGSPAGTMQGEKPNRVEILPRCGRTQPGRI